MVGSAEELYHAMENDSVDLAINDQRRAFSSCSDHAFKIANTSRHLS